MGTIIATCGHYITIEEMYTGGIKIKDNFTDWDGIGRCITSLVVCPRCLHKYQRVMVKDKEDEEKWLNG